MPTNQLTIPRPQTGEYALYYQGYISMVSTDDLLPALGTQWRDTVALLSGLKETEGDFRYAPGKWTVKEVLGHLVDAERIFGYRALRIARNDKTPMEGFEQDDYVKYGPFGQCSLASLVEEFKSVRQATLSLFRGFDEAAWVRRGVANKNEVSVRAIAYIIAGHELHHQKILQEKYFTRAAV